MIATIKKSAAVLATLVLVVFPAAAATEYAPAGISLAQLLERSRHAAGSYAAGAFHLVSRSVPLHGDVSTTETFWNGDDYRTTTREGGFSWSYGAYRGRQWHGDSNGTVLPSSNFAEENDPFSLALEHTGQPGSGVTLLGMTAGSSPAFVVDVTPSSGLRERRYYDAHTYLLTRVELTDYDGHHRVWEYRDYRPTFGRMLAHAVDYEGDNSVVTAHATVEAVDRVDAARLDLSVPPSKPLFDLGGREAVVIPARFTEDGIIVPASIGGRGLDFLLDSGSSDLLIDPNVARELGMTLTGAERVSFAGDYLVANARAAEFSVADLNAKDVAFSTAKLSEWVPWLPNQRVVGLLGGDLIATGALKVDFEKKLLTLFRRVPADLAAQGWSALPIRLDYGIPLIGAAYSGRPGHFVADLGAVYTMLYPHYFDRFQIKVPRGTPEADELVTLGGRPFGIRHFTMNRLVLGDWIFGDVQVVVPTVDYAQERDYDGLIGRDTLSTFNLIFDYKDGELWFKPIDFGNK